MAKKAINNSEVWIFCGEGMGIAGLPHRVTMKEAQERGMVLELEAGIENGSYRKERAEGGKLPEGTYYSSGGENGAESITPIGKVR